MRTANWKQSSRFYWRLCRAEMQSNSERMALGLLLSTCWGRVCGRLRRLPSRHRPTSSHSSALMVAYRFKDDFAALTPSTTQFSVARLMLQKVPSDCNGYSRGNDQGYEFVEGVDHR